MKRLIFFAFLNLPFFAFAQQSIDVQEYHFEIELSDQSDSITGKAIITVKFLKDASEVKFDLASIENEKGMIALKVSEGDQVLRTIHSNNILTINLNKGAKQGEVRNLEIYYMGTPKDGLIISKNKYGDRTFFADNWPNRAHNWIPCNDVPGDKAPFEFIVTAPSHYRVISNGFKIEETNLDNNRKRTYWKEETPLSTKIMVIGVAKFAVKQFADSPDTIPVSAWVFPQDSTKGFYDYGISPEILKFFSAYIAPFPYKKLANVQSKTIFGGMENAGAIFYSEKSVTGDRKWEDVIAHEIVHQWFGDMASEKSFAHLWLSEGFATYLTNVYFENRYGKDSAVKRLQQERENVITFAKTNKRAVVDSTKDLMSLLNANSYEKGGWILHMLRQETGDSIFRKIIQTYYQQFKGSNADTRDFEKVAEVVSGKELTWFFDQWLYQPDIPNLDINFFVDKDKVEIKVKQLQKKLYRFPLEIKIADDDGNIILKKIEINQIMTEVKFKIDKKIKEVIFDPDTDLLFQRTISQLKTKKD